MYVGAREPHDTIELTGTPGLKLIPGGTHGDFATAAVVVNSIARFLPRRRACALREICRWDSFRRICGRNYLFFQKRATAT